MEPREFQIGIYVNVDNIKHHRQLTLQKSILKVVGISMTDNGYSIALNTLDVTKQDVSPLLSQFMKYIKPIPLTEEWLIKFGFKLTENHVGYNEYRLNTLGFRVQCSKNNNPVSLCNNRGYITDFIHVHQLQNLYFALTGEELEIKD
jgi:hypothetical protein